MKRVFQITVSEKVLHFKRPAGTSRGVYQTRRCWLLTVIDCRMLGVKGVGECAPLPDLSCDAVPQYEQILRDVCAQVEVTGAIPYDALRPYPSILFGLETAFAQLNAGGSDVLFDSPFSRGEAGISINGLVWMGTFEGMYARLEEKLKLGFQCIKLKIGAIDFESELQLVRRVRTHFGKEQVELRLDANGGFAPDEALARLERFAPYAIHSVEQPIRQHQWDEMARICCQSPIPIALDEELIGVNLPAMKAELLDRIRPAYIILKPSLHGGMRGVEEWITLARARGIGSWITSALESNVGLNAIAQLAARFYGPNIDLPQGLGTGQLFTDNIPKPLSIRGDKLWFTAK